MVYQHLDTVRLFIISAVKYLGLKITNYMCKHITCVSCETTHLIALHDEFISELVEFIQRTVVSVLAFFF